MEKQVQARASISQSERNRLIMEGTSCSSGLVGNRQSFGAGFSLNRHDACKLPLLRVAQAHAGFSFWYCPLSRKTLCFSTSIWLFR